MPSSRSSTLSPLAGYVHVCPISYRWRRCGYGRQTTSRKSHLQLGRASTIGLRASGLGYSMLFERLVDHHLGGLRLGWVSYDQSSAGIDSGY